MKDGDGGVGVEKNPHVLFSPNTIHSVTPCFPSGSLPPLPWRLHILLMKKSVKETKKTRYFGANGNAA